MVRSKLWGGVRRKMYKTKSIRKQTKSNRKPNSLRRKRYSRNESKRSKHKGGTHAISDPPNPKFKLNQRLWYKVDPGKPFSHDIPVVVIKVNMDHSPFTYNITKTNNDGVPLGWRMDNTMHNINGVAETYLSEMLLNTGQPVPLNRSGTGLQPPNGFSTNWGSPSTNQFQVTREQ